MNLDIINTQQIVNRFTFTNAPANEEWISKENYDKREDRIRMLIMKLKIDATNEIDDPRYILMVLNQIENDL